MNKTDPISLNRVSRDVVFGSHLVADYRGVAPDLLNSPDRIIDILVKAAAAADATVVDSCIHQFSPYGVTATVTLAESHISFHSWPEHNYAAVDVFVCGKADAAAALRHITSMLQPHSVDVCELKRGKLPQAI
mgnify:CR=1 FL=1